MKSVGEMIQDCESNFSRFNNTLIAKYYLQYLEGSFIGTLQREEIISSMVNNPDNVSDLYKTIKSITCNSK